LWLSDILFIDRIPALDGSLKGWLEVMRQQARVNAVMAVPGHGPVSVSWPRSMEKQADYLTLLLDQTRKFIADGSFMEEI
ncbi:MAG: MBL fold metallo-hydrolase, partial [Candidatus Aminicenantes bacterium]|nr:MBL fold metallo-hydrolase [Gammaproteobacteria bacterium]NIO61498.1 MBL fold metallo-hydrolase [Gammaproteobacteria bacterium]NIO82489.1 MBL fold metallo-hydrolase [Candidatus Aminicenantes bacterium]NIT23456.1 MBL fold metallo-hydrolase [Candidatus Aminicenantes bacterium]